MGVGGGVTATMQGNNASTTMVTATATGAATIKELYNSRSGGRHLPVKITAGGTQASQGIIDSGAAVIGVLIVP